MKVHYTPVPKEERTFGTEVYCRRAPNYSSMTSIKHLVTCQWCIRKFSESTAKAEGR